MIGFMINPKSVHPAWKQVGMILETRIRSGVLPADERIPTEVELMSEFEIGRTTARKAVEYLRVAGLVTTQPGRGTYVL
jgi:DNA-binding GntR family transcriptional regulator